MKKISLLAVALAAATFGALASGYTHSLLVNYKSGDVVEFQFEDEPKMVFVDDEIEITANGNEGYLLQPIANIQNLTFSQKEAGVEGLKADGKHIVVTCNGKMLTMKGLNANAPLSIYSVSGMLCEKAVADGDGAISLSLHRLPAGVYVAATPEYTFKFVKK